MGDFQRLAPKLLQYINDFEKRFGITKKLLHKPQNSLIFSSEDYDLVANPLPLILVYDNHRYIRIVSMKYQEYCALKSLKLGKDIQTIATDTEANVKRLQAYSKRHQLALRIISFADLKRAHNSLTFEYPLSREQILNRPSGIKMLNDFCDEQQKRFTEDWITNSLIDFQEAAKTIILSDRSPEEKRVQLKKYANDEFKHRHYLPRLLADILILLSSPLLIGLSVGIINRVLNGHSFFFSFEKTKRETEFDKIADRMKLDY